jgi:hypothetical protein
LRVSLRFYNEAVEECAEISGKVNDSNGDRSRCRESEGATFAVHEWAKVDLMPVCEH